MGWRTYVRNAVLEAALLLGLPGQFGVEIPQPPQIRAQRANSAPGADLAAREDRLLQGIGFHDQALTQRTELRGRSNTIAFLAAAFGRWPVAAVDFDPDLLRSQSVETRTRFDATRETIHAETDGMAMLEQNGFDLFDPAYPQVEKAAFTEPVLNSHLAPIENIDDLSAAMHVEAHEGVHGNHYERENLLAVLESGAHEYSVGASRLTGHGPALEALLASGETREETEARHARMASVSPEQGDDADYCLHYTELRSYLGDLLIGGISSGAWSRLPATRQELWAAFYNFAGGLAKGPDAVNRSLVGREGEKRRNAFPAPVADPELDIAQRVVDQALSRIPEANRPAFYEQVLPEIYGELLEDLGDRSGKVKMGLPAGPVYSMAFAHHLIYDRRGAAAAWDARMWRKVAAKVEPEKIERLCELSVVHRNAEALQALLDAADRNPKAYRISDSGKAGLLQGAIQVAARPAGAVEAAHARQSVEILRSYGARLPDRQGFAFTSVKDIGKEPEASRPEPTKGEVLGSQPGYGGDAAPLPGQAKPGRVRQR
ncbi:MAG: hypothetical protein PW734_00655 [Verrucomicrobium sp.]|nr:hypothetical protein [Verrucomicrobium sp.]